MVENLDLSLKNILKQIDLNNKPNLFLHICCAPCSSYVLEYLYSYFNIYIVFYNPNIDTKIEFDKRYNELLKLLNINKYNLKILYNDYCHNEYIDYVKGLEKEIEGGKRCSKCFELRLKKTFEIAKEFIVNNNLTKKTNYWTTTLTISPHKNANLIYEIAKNIDNEEYIKYLPSDFKKNDGYLKSIQLSKKYNLYRQNYCGCEFAKN